LTHIEEDVQQREKGQQHQEEEEEEVVALSRITAGSTESV